MNDWTARKVVYAIPATTPPAASAAANIMALGGGVGIPGAAALLVAVAPAAALLVPVAYEPVVTLPVFCGGLAEDCSAVAG